MNYKKDKDENTYVFFGDSKKSNRLIKTKNVSNPFSKLLSLNIK